MFGRPPVYLHNREDVLFFKTPSMLYNDEDGSLYELWPYEMGLPVVLAPMDGEGVSEPRVVRIIHDIILCHDYPPGTSQVDAILVVRNDILVHDRQCRQVDVETNMIVDEIVMRNDGFLVCSNQIAMLSLS